jgi:hypothetical protein
MKCGIAIPFWLFPSPFFTRPSELDFPLASAMPPGAIARTGRFELGERRVGEHRRGHNQIDPRVRAQRNARTRGQREANFYLISHAVLCGMSIAK